MKLLSVTVPCYNSAGYMRNCVESLLKGGDRVEIIIVDDGSTDETAQIADEYAEKYQNVKVVHQENGGHGEGINSGLKLASGKFFKVIDSDDVAGVCFNQFLDRLSKETEAGSADLIVTNYVYTYQDGRKDNVINYRRPLIKNKLLTWQDTRSFSVKQYLTIHSCTFRTEVMRKSGLNLPKHIFYEDNLMVCQILPFVEKIYYLDLDLYRYSIGRAGQSVQEDVFIKRYTHQLYVAEAIFKTCHLDEIKQKSQKLYSVLYHEMFMMFGIATIFARQSKEPDAEKNLQTMWDNAIAFDEKYGKRFRHKSLLKFINIKGKFGKKCTVFFYRLAHLVVKFN